LPRENSLWGKIKMGFTERFFSVVVLAAVVLIMLCSGLSCAAPAPEPAPQANRRPVIQQVTGSSDWFPQTEGKFTCTVSDPDGDRLSYNWAAYNGTISGNGADAVWTSPAATGKYNITVTVSDGKGGEASKVQEARVNVNPDAPVVLKMSLPSRETVTGAKRVRSWLNSRIECIVEGADAMNLKYSWTSTDGTLRAGTGFSLEGGTARVVDWMAPAAGGDYAVKVTVTDGSGNEAKGQVDFKVVCCTTE
jgi:hypothetical protein